MKKGFTLIEILVVVLIIGILAAIAVPKYEASVLKSRYIQAMTLADAIMKDQQDYFLANGKYASAFTDLDVMPTPARSSSNNTAYHYGWGYCQLACLINTGSHCGGCRVTSQQGELTYWYEPWGEIRYCVVTATWELANKVCQNQTGLKQPTTTNQWGLSLYQYK